MIERCIAANFDVLALTVDTITGGNRERDLRTGFTSPPRLTLKSLLSFAVHPRWAVNYITHEKFALPQLKDYVKEGSNVSVSVGDYFSTMLDQSMNWKDAETVRKKWGKQFCLKGIMSGADGSVLWTLVRPLSWYPITADVSSTGRGAHLTSSPRSSMLSATG
jgi:L-lactate dehydrogenase (cytochrome)